MAKDKLLFGEKPEGNNQQSAENDLQRFICQAHHFPPGSSRRMRDQTASRADTEMMCAFC